MTRCLSLSLVAALVAGCQAEAAIDHSAEDITNPTGQAKQAWLAAFGECGGSIIADRWVLTARHCISYYIRWTNQAAATAVDTEVSFNNAKDNAQKSKVFYWSPGADLALIRLPDKVTAMPVTLPTGDTPAAKSVTVFGTRKNRAKTPGEWWYREGVTVEAVTDDKFGSEYGCGDDFTNEGDSGSALTVKPPKCVVEEQRAVVRGSNLLDKKVPGRYTRTDVQHNNDWVKMWMDAKTTESLTCDRYLAAFGYPAAGKACDKKEADTGCDPDSVKTSDCLRCCSRSPLKASGFDSDDTQSFGAGHHRNGGIVTTHHTGNFPFSLESRQDEPGAHTWYPTNFHKDTAGYEWAMTSSAASLYVFYLKGANRHVVYETITIPRLGMAGISIPLHNQSAKNLRAVTLNDGSILALWLGQKSDELAGKRMSDPDKLGKVVEQTFDDGAGKPHKLPAMKKFEVGLQENGRHAILFIDGKDGKLHALTGQAGDPSRYDLVTLADVDGVLDVAVTRAADGKLVACYVTKGNALYAWEQSAKNGGKWEAKPVDLGKADVAKVAAILGSDGKTRVFTISKTGALGYGVQTKPPALAVTHLDLKAKAELMLPVVNADSRVQLFYTDPDDDKKLKSQMITTTWRSP